MTARKPAKPKDAAAPGYSAKVSAIATLYGQLSAYQQSDLIAFLALVPGGLVCLGLYVSYSSVLAGVLAATCFGTLVLTVLVRLWRSTKEPANPSVVTVHADGTTQVSGHVKNPAALAISMRRMLLGRNGVPMPSGEIQGAASDENAVRPYSPPEQQLVFERVRREVEESDANAIDGATKRITAQLPAPGPYAIQPPAEPSPDGAAGR